VTAAPPAEVLVRRAGYPVADALVEEILERFAPPLAGRRVLVKPNCLMAAAPERAVTTHPSLVRALVRALRRRGAAVTVGDNPGARAYGAARASFAAAGLLEAAEGAYEDIGSRTAVAPLAFGSSRRAIVSAAVLEADWLVTVPKLKTHCLTLLTGAVKNHYGILAGAEKARLHREAPSGARFAAALAAVCAVRPPDLAVMDAVVAMEGDGPSHGRPREVGLVLASPDPVALDATAARLIGLDPSRVAHLRAAAEAGIGSDDPAAIRVDGDPGSLPALRLPSTFRAGLLQALSGHLVFNLLHRSRLRVDVRKCRDCGACVDACPAGAMTRRAGSIAIDEGRCQVCFCCAEVCPEGAVAARGALGALLARGGKG
jgi:uncharacterized protein (DUF362 family)/ferredoxin